MKMFVRKIIFLLVLMTTFTSLVYSLDCYLCRSDIDPQCATTPGKHIDVAECKENDKCVVVIVNGVTHRNCLSQMVRPCTPNDPDCHMCDIPLCNGIVFPENRRQCIQCSGNSCLNITQSKIPSRPCPKYVKNDRCFTNIIGINNIIRGCVSDAKETCDNVCLKCNYDGCNTEMGVFNNTCYSCQFMGGGPNTIPKPYQCKRAQDNFNNEQCLITNLTLCSQPSILGHKEKCFTHFNSNTNTLTRGCSTKMGHFPSGKLWECYGENCNTDCIDMKCNVCDFDTDPNCRNNTKLLKSQSCSNDTFSCYSCENKGGHVTRGCGYKETTNEQKCYQCFDEDGCNKQNTRTCYKCTSTQNGNCTDLNDISGIDHELCKTITEKCVATVTDNYVVRGCQSSIVECTEGDPNCQRCDGSLCNTGIFN